MAAKGKIQGIKFTREMSFQEVKNKIIRAFEVDTFVVLDCDGHNLIKCSVQLRTGKTNLRVFLHLSYEYNYCYHN